MFLVEVLLGIILSGVFGLLGIYVSNKNKFLKNFNNKQNLIYVSIFYILIVIITVNVLKIDGVTDPVEQIGYGLGYFIPSYLGAILASFVYSKFKKIFNKNFYHALLGSITLSYIFLLII